MRTDPQHVQVVAIEDDDRYRAGLEALLDASSEFTLARSFPSPADQLRSVVAGGSPLSAGIARTVLDVMRLGAAGRLHIEEPATGAAAPALDLTAREHDVLACLVDGVSYRRARATSRIDTVRSRVRAIYGKLQVHSVAEAVSRALRGKLL